MVASWVAHIPELKRAFGLSDGALGLVLIGAPLGAIVAMLATGPLLGRFGSKRLIQILLGGYVVAAVVVGVVPNGMALFWALALWGACQGSLDVAMNTQGASLERDYGLPLMNRLHGTWSIASLIGALVGAGSVKIGLALAPQQVVLAVLIAIGVGAAARHLHDDAHRAAGVGGGEPARRRRLSALSGILGLGAIACLSMLCEGIIANWSAEYLRTDLGSSAAYGALGYVTFTFAMSVIRLVGNRLATNRPANTMVAVLAALAALAFGVALVLRQPPLALVGFLALGLGLGCVVPTMFALAGRRSSGPNAGAAIAATATAGWIGYVVGPPLIGALADRFTLSVALWILPVALLAISIATSRMTPGPRAR
jgi:MFS family permease